MKGPSMNAKLLAFALACSPLVAGADPAPHSTDQAPAS